MRDLPVTHKRKQEGYVTSHQMVTPVQLLREREKEREMPCRIRTREKCKYALFTNLFSSLQKLIPHLENEVLPDYNTTKS